MTSPVTSGSFYALYYTAASQYALILSAAAYKHHLAVFSRLPELTSLL